MMAPSPLRYPGGKSWLIPIVQPWLSSLPRGTRLLEPFAGGASVGLAALMARPDVSLALWDLDSDLAAFWKCLVYGDAGIVANHLDAMDSPDSLPFAEAQQPWQAALEVIVRNRVNYGGILRGWNCRPTRWYPKTVARRIRSIQTLRGRIEFSQACGMAAIRSAPSRSALFVDPPYPTHGRRLYRHHDVQVEDVLSGLWEANRPFLMTMEDVPEIVRRAESYSFHVRRIKMKTAHHRRKEELLISGYCDRAE